MSTEACSQNQAAAADRRRILGPVCCGFPLANQNLMTIPAEGCAVCVTLSAFNPPRLKSGVL